MSLSEGRQPRRHGRRIGRWVAMVLRQYPGLELGTARRGIELSGRLSDVGHQKDGAGRTTLAGVLGLEAFHGCANLGTAGILGRPD